MPYKNYFLIESADRALANIVVMLSDGMYYGYASGDALLAVFAVGCSLLTLCLCQFSLLKCKQNQGVK